jgi:hypothetical protein
MVNKIEGGLFHCLLGFIFSMAGMLAPILRVGIRPSSGGREQRRVPEHITGTRQTLRVRIRLRGNRRAAVLFGRVR